MSAISILEKIYKINPKNFNSIELNLEILKTINNKKLLNAKIERLKKENFLKKEGDKFNFKKIEPMKVQNFFLIQVCCLN